MYILCVCMFCACGVVRTVVGRADICGADKENAIDVAKKSRKKLIILPWHLILCCAVFLRFPFSTDMCIQVESKGFAWISLSIFFSVSLSTYGDSDSGKTRKKQMNYWFGKLVTKYLWSAQYIREGK